MNTFEAAEPIPLTKKQIHEIAKRAGCKIKKVRRIINDDIKGCQYFTNDIYHVTRKDVGEGWTHLSIKRRDQESCHDWRHFQQIKNELCGKEREAVEIFPAESRLIDTSNQYHLWVLPEGERVPCGYATGRSVDYTPGQGVGNKQGWKQRPLDNA